MFEKEWSLFLKIMSFIGKGGSLFLVFAVFLFLIIMLARVHIVRKSAYPEWSVWIPFYSGHIFYKMMWKSYMFWITIGLAVLIKFANYFGDGVMLSSIVQILLAVVILVIYGAYSYNFSKAFGYGVAFAVFAFLLPFPAMMVAGFGKAKYIDQWYRG